MNLLNEVWKPIPNYPNYEISNYGRVKSLSYRQQGYPQVLKLRTNKLGYWYCNISNGGMRKTVKAHVLVALTFIGERPSIKNQINHIDGNKDNNHVSNLEYCTASENIRHSYETGLNVAPTGYNHLNSKLTEKEVQEIRSHYEKNKHKYFWGAKDLSKKYGVCLQTISNVAKEVCYK